MVFNANGVASRTSSGSSSAAYTSALAASESERPLMAILRIEQPAQPSKVAANMISTVDPCERDANDPDPQLGRLISNLYDPLNGGAIPVRNEPIRRLRRPDLCSAPVDARLVARVILRTIQLPIGTLEIRKEGIARLIPPDEREVHRIRAGHRGDQDQLAHHAFPTSLDSAGCVQPINGSPGRTTWPVISIGSATASARGVPRRRCGRRRGRRAP